jgi:hypothetical protein
VWIKTEKESLLRRVPNIFGPSVLREEAVMFAEPVVYLGDIFYFLERYLSSDSMDYED